MKLVKHALEQPFITATGIAALVHSTWALGTIFSGEQPAVEDINSFIELVHFIGWLLPALLIAFALDIGQISTSIQIRNDGVTLGRGITFFVFSVATFFLQWFYMMHHIPLVTIGAGVSATYAPLVTAMRDAGLFVVPALLPIATLLYTFSGDTVRLRDAQPQQQHAPLVVQTIEPLALPDTVNLLEIEYPTFGVACSCCDWQMTYDNADSATRGLRAHQQKCKSYQQSAIEVQA